MRKFNVFILLFSCLVFAFFGYVGTNPSSALATGTPVITSVAESGGDYVVTWSGVDGTHTDCNPNPYVSWIGETDADPLSSFSNGCTQTGGSGVITADLSNLSVVVKLYYGGIEHASAPVTLGANGEYSTATPTPTPAPTAVPTIAPITGDQTGMDNTQALVAGFKNVMTGNLAVLVPIAAVLLISIAVVFWVIKKFRTIVRN